jgi:hypothetical protein
MKRPWYNISDGRLVEPDQFLAGGGETEVAGQRQYSAAGHGMAGYGAGGGQGQGIKVESELVEAGEKVDDRGAVECDQLR